MPNWIDDGDFGHAPRMRSTQHGAARKKRQTEPVFCSFDYQLGDIAIGIAGNPLIDDDEALCANKAIRHTDPPRCASHGGVHAADSRKRTEGGYVKISERQRQLQTGDISLDDLDEEELVRGQLRDKDGKFRGKANFVSRKMHQRMTSELFKRANDEMKTNLVEAVKTLTAIMNNADMDPKDRMKAAQWIVERTMGKMPETVTVRQDAPWQSILTKVTNEGATAYADEVKGQQEDDRF